MLCGGGGRFGDGRGNLINTLIEKKHRNWNGFGLPALAVAAELVVEFVDSVDSVVAVAVASLAIRFLDYHEYHSHLNWPLHLAMVHSMTNYCSNFANYSTLACYSSAYHFAYESTNCLSLSSNSYRYHNGTVCSRKYKIRRVLNVDVAGLNSGLE